MKIAIVGLFPADPSNIVGGVEATTLRLCEGLSRSPGVEIDVVVSSPEQKTGTRRIAPNWTVRSVGSFDRFGNVLLGLPDRRRMVRALRRLGPDIVHAHSADRHALAALDSGLPAVVSIHGVIEEETRLERRPMERLRGLFRNRMVGDVLRRARNVIYVSPYLKERYDARLARARRWGVENPVAPVFFASRGGEGPRRVL
ncbi:MAG: glycosyltransferase family 4 protein, partial [Candidatus Eisenbacteria bacterium]